MRISDWSSDVCSSDLLDSWYWNAGCRHHRRTRRQRFHRGISCVAAAGFADGHPVVLSRDTAERHAADRSEEHTSELQSLMRHSYAVFCLKKQQHTSYTKTNNTIPSTPYKHSDIKHNKTYLTDLEQ